MKLSDDEPQYGDQRPRVPRPEEARRATEFAGGAKAVGARLRARRATELFIEQHREELASRYGHDTFLAIQGNEVIAHAETYEDLLEEVGRAAVYRLGIVLKRLDDDERPLVLNQP